MDPGPTCSVVLPVVAAEGVCAACGFWLFSELSHHTHCRIMDYEAV